MALLVASTAARAGWYEITFSGGTCSTPGTSTPYYWQQGWGYGASGNSTNPVAPFVTCSGQITATFTWTTDDPLNDLPPTAIIVKEQCSTRARGYPIQGAPTFSLSASDGFGDAQVWNGPRDVSSSGTRYSIKNNPGSSFTVICSPAASISATGFAQTNANVWYGVGYFTPWILLEGTTVREPDMTQHILIGQGCQASLRPPIPGVSFQNFQWTISGDTFKDYAAGGYHTTQRAEEWFLTSTDLNVASPHWYWRSEGGDTGNSSETVTVTADVVAGATTVGTITVIENLTVWAPYYSCGYNAGAVYIIGNPGGDPGWPFRIEAAGPGGVGAGISWTGICDQQALFREANGGAGIGTGYWHFLQTIKPGRWYTDNAGLVWRWSINGLWGLDTHYPYPYWDDYAPFPPGLVLDDPSPPRSKPDNHSEWSTSDNPSMTINNTITNVTIDEDFWTYMMYRPPNTYGLGNRWVSLHRIKWNWAGNQNRPPPPAGWAALAIPHWVGPVTVSEIGRYRNHPVWVHVYAPSVLFYPFLNP